MTLEKRDAQECEPGTTTEAASKTDFLKKPLKR